MRNGWAVLVLVVMVMAGRAQCEEPAATSAASRPVPASELPGPARTAPDAPSDTAAPPLGAAVRQIPAAPVTNPGPFSQAQASAQAPPQAEGRVRYVRHPNRVGRAIGGFGGWLSRFGMDRHYVEPAERASVQPSPQR